MCETVNFYCHEKQRRGQYLATFLSCGGSFASGAAIGWSSSVYNDLVLNEEDDDCELRFCVSQMAFMWVISILALGAMLISIFTGIIMNHLGRKGAQIIFLFPIVLGWISTLFARTEIMLYAGRFFVGLSCGAYSVIIPIYINEIADKDVRGRLLAWSQFMQFSGITFAFALGFVLNMFNMDLVCSAMVLIYGIGLIFIPESPIHLVEKEEIDGAICAMRKLYGTSFDSVSEVARMIQAKTPPNEFEDSLVSEWKHLLKNQANRRALYIVIGLCFFLHMSGIYALIFTLTNIFDSCQTKINSKTISIIIGLSMMLSSFVCVVNIDRVGRRKLLLFSTAGMIVMACFMVIHLYFEYCCAPMMQGLEYFVIVFASLYTGFFAVGFGPVTFVIMAEIFSKEVTHLAMSVGIMINYILMFCMGMLFYPVLRAISLVGVFAVFTLVSVLAFVFVIFVVPETNGKSYEEIESLLSSSTSEEREIKRHERTSGCSLTKITVTDIDIKSYFN